MIHVKDSRILPWGKVWFLDFLGIYIYLVVSYVMLYVATMAIFEGCYFVTVEIVTCEACDDLFLLLKLACATSC